MNPDSNPIWSLVWTFGLMSLFAVGGANAAIPEMQRIAVEVRHWMTDREFADIYAISQLSPGPNVLIVTLIGYSVAGLGGALAATLAMCVPTAALAYFVSGFLKRSSHARWPSIVQAALVPLSAEAMQSAMLIKFLRGNLAIVMPDATCPVKLATEKRTFISQCSIAMKRAHNF